VDDAEVGPDPRALSDAGFPVSTCEACGGLDAARLLALLGRVMCVVYSGQLLDNGAFRETFTGPGVEHLLGGAPPDGVTPVEAWDTLVHPDDWDRYAAAGTDLVAGGSVTVEYRMRGYDGTTRWVLDSQWLGRRVWGRQLIDGVITDITLLHQRSQELVEALNSANEANAALENARADAERRAGTDELTGLMNRRHFLADLTAQLREDAAAGASSGLLLVDIDHFKDVNDRFGHSAGDEVLVRFAALLRGLVRPGDRLGRWGGEEFIVLLPGAGSGPILAERAEQVRAGIAAAAFTAEGHSLRLQASVGGVRSAPGTAPDELIQNADRALYEAKDAGRNTVVTVRMVG
jgi:diguanylate cyclase (GGDEF)-like protein